nr:iron ABC transporter permease [Haloimpatiens massiliensis]
MKNKKRVSKFLDTHLYNFFDLLIILILILSILIFIFWPILSVAKQSIYHDGGFSFNFYKEILKENKKLITNGIFVASLSTLFSIIISIYVAVYISFSESKIKKILFIILMITMISPPFVSSLAYINLFGRRGFITHNILKLTLNTYGWYGIVAMQTLSHVSLNAIILSGVISGIDKSIIEASLDSGASVNYTIRKVVIPMMIPGIIVASLLTFVRCFSDFGTPMIIGGSFNVIATQIYIEIIANSNLPKAAAMNMLLIIPCIIAFIAYRFYMKKNNSTLGGAQKASSREMKLKFNGFLGALIKFITYTFIFIMVLQYISIFISAITVYRKGKMYFSLDNIIKLKNYSSKSFIRSIIYSTIAGIIGSFIGMLTAYYTERRKILGMKQVDFIATLPYIIPGTFFGIGYILAFNDYPMKLTGTAAIVILNCIFKQLPMTTKVSSAVVSYIDREVEYAGKDCGASNFFILKDIIIPSLKPAFLMGFINNFTATMTTIGSIIFLIYPGQKVATVEMFDAIQSGEYGLGAVIACIIILITLAINLLFSKWVLGGKNVSTIKKFSKEF